MLHVRDIGLSSYEKLRKERFLDKTTRLFETIHRTNLKTFSSIHKPGQAQMASGKSSTYRDGQMQKVLEVARARGTSMEELLRYDVSSSSPLFDEDGFMTNATKSDIVKEMEQYLNGDDSRTPQTMNGKLQTLYILDVMAAVRRIASKSHSNFSQLCDDVLKHAKNLSKGANRIDLVFDSYLDKSIKSSERQRREKKLPIELHEIIRETPLPVDMARFWPSSSNKLKLEKLLHQEALRQGTRLFPNIQVVASHFTGGEDTNVPCSMLSIGGSCSEV